MSITKELSKKLTENCLETFFKRTGIKNLKYCLKICDDTGIESVKDLYENKNELDKYFLKPIFLKKILNYIDKNFKEDSYEQETNEKHIKCKDDNHEETKYIRKFAFYKEKNKYEGYKPVDYVLNYGMTQFTIGKTAKAMHNIIKRFEIKQKINPHIYHPTLIFSRNNIEENKQWSSRTKNNSLIALEFSSKSKEIDCREKLVEVFTSSKTKEELPMCIVMCNHPKRIDDIIYLIELLGESLKLRSSTGYKYTKFDIILDEAPLCISNIKKLITSVPNTLNYEYNDLPCIITQVMFITATPDDKKFLDLLQKEFCINSIRKLENKEISDTEIIDLKNHYKSIESHPKIYYDNTCYDPVEYVDSYMDNIKGNNNTIFAPSTWKCEGHERMADIFKMRGYICLVHNGKNKEFRFPNGKILTIYDFIKNYNIKGELRDVMRKFRKIYPNQNLAITGNTTIGTGVTWNTNNFNFSHMFISMYHGKNPSDLRQMLGRATGHKNFIGDITLIMPRELYTKFSIRLKNIEYIMNKKDDDIFFESLRNTNKEEFIAYNIPIVIGVKDYDVKILRNLKSVERKDKIYELSKSSISNVNYTRQNLIYVKEPNTDNSYKKHIIDYVKKYENKKRCGLIDVKWQSRDKEYYYKKCWMSFIDNRKNRLILLLWDGLELKR